MYKVIMMNLNNFQGEQLWKTIWKIFKTFVISPTKKILLVVTGYIFQHSLSYFIHTNAMNPFSKLTNGEKSWIVVTNFLYFLREIFRRHANFSASYIFHPAQNRKISTQTNLFYSYQCNEPIFKVGKWGKSYEILLQTFYRFFKKLCVAMPTFQHRCYSIWLRTKRFFNTDRLILFIPMQWTHFQSWQMGKKLWNITTNFLYNFQKIVRRNSNFTASDLIHPAQNKKIFQHKPIYFIHTNAMNPFSKLTNGEKAMKYRHKVFIDFSKNCA